MKSILFVILSGLFLIGCASTPQGSGCPANCKGKCCNPAQTECAK